MDLHLRFMLPPLHDYDSTALYTTWTVAPGVHLLAGGGGEGRGSGDGGGVRMAMQLASYTPCWIFFCIGKAEHIRCIIGTIGCTHDIGVSAAELLIVAECLALVPGSRPAGCRAAGSRKWSQRQEAEGGRAKVKAKAKVWGMASAGAAALGSDGLLLVPASTLTTACCAARAIKCGTHTCCCMTACCPSCWCSVAVAGKRTATLGLHNGRASLPRLPCCIAPDGGG